MERRIKSLAAKQQRSLSLLADQAHYAGDAKMNFIGGVGLVIVLLTELFYLDALFAIAGALFAFWAVIPTFSASLRDILHIHLQSTYYSVFSINISM